MAFCGLCIFFRSLIACWRLWDYLAYVLVFLCLNRVCSFISFMQPCGVGNTASMLSKRTKINDKGKEKPKIFSYCDLMTDLGLASKGSHFGQIDQILHNANN